MWTEKKEATLRRLMKERLSLSVADPSHDIQFARNLIEGQDAEKLVVEALTKGEIKRDYGAGDTGNVFVEFESRKKPSGISTSEADYWVFVLSGDRFKDEVFIGIKTSRLKKIVDSLGWTVNGGDNNTSKGKLVKLGRLIRNVA